MGARAAPQTGVVMVAAVHVPDGNGSDKNEYQGSTNGDKDHRSIVVAVVVVLFVNDR